MGKAPCLQQKLRVTDIRLEVRIATFMGCSWPDGFVNHGPIKRVDGRKPGTSIDNGSGSGDDSKAGPSSSESK